MISAGHVVSAGHIVSMGHIVSGGHVISVGHVVSAGHMDCVNLGFIGKVSVCQSFSQDPFLFFQLGMGSDPKDG